VPSIRKFVRGERKLVMTTCYDYPTARFLDRAGLDAVLVGDSVGNTVQGHPDTVSVTLEQMIYHTEMVSRAAENMLVIGDLPFMSYQLSAEQGLESAGRLMKEGRCQAVKMEGGGRVVDTVMRIVEAGVPVMGHLGHTPQSVHIQGHRFQGQDEETARRLITDAEDLEAAGAFALVLEYVPRQLARRITESLRIPTIGIGSGPDCSGQVLVFHDLFGLTEGKPFRHTMVTQNLGDAITEGAKAFRAAVEQGSFPSEENGAELKPEVAEALGITTAAPQPAEKEPRGAENSN